MIIRAGPPGSADASILGGPGDYSLRSTCAVYCPALLAPAPARRPQAHVPTAPAQGSSGSTNNFGTPPLFPHASPWSAPTIMVRLLPVRTFSAAATAPLALMSPMAGPQQQLR